MAPGGRRRTAHLRQPKVVGRAPAKGTNNSGCAVTALALAGGVLAAAGAAIWTATEAIRSVV